MECFFPYTIFLLYQKALHNCSNLPSNIFPLLPEVAPGHGHSDGNTAVSHLDSRALDLPQFLQPPLISTFSHHMCGHDDVSHVAPLVAPVISIALCEMPPILHLCKQTSFHSSLLFLPWLSLCQVVPPQASS